MNQDPVFRGGRRAVLAAAIAAAAGVLILVVFGALRPDDFFPAYLAAYACVTSVALGALIFLMIGHAMRAGWPTLLRRITEGMVAALPALAVLFIPLLFGLRRLYPWLRLDTIEDAAERAVVMKKLAYLNSGSFIGRTAVFFGLWIVIGYLLRRLSHAQDQDPAYPAQRRLHAAGGALLPIVALSLSFAAFDWLMSLQPAWYSTMFPVYYFAGGFLGALATLTLGTAAADRSGAIRGITPSHYHALGRLLLAFVIFWAYVAFFQLMLIWIANKPEEIVFYLVRVTGGWEAVTIVLIVAHFVVPFFFLLSYDIKHRRRPMAFIAAFVLAAHYIDIHWLVMPPFRQHGSPYRVIDLGALLAVGGITVGFALLRLRGRPLVPIHDPALEKALRYES